MASKVHLEAISASRLSSTSQLDTDPWSSQAICHTFMSHKRHTTFRLLVSPFHCRSLTARTPCSYSFHHLAVSTPLSGSFLQHDVTITLRLLRRKTHGGSVRCLLLELPFVLSLALPPARQVGILRGRRGSSLNFSVIFEMTPRPVRNAIAGFLYHYSFRGEGACRHRPVRIEEGSRVGERCCYQQFNLWIYTQSR